MKLRRIEADSPELEQFIEGTYTDQKQFEGQVANIAEEVRKRGDLAIFDLTAKYDGASIDHSNFMVSDEEIEKAYDLVDDEYLHALREAIDNIYQFHLRQLRNSWIEPDEKGNILGQIYRPLNRVGIYVPGGTAAYPSSVLMNTIPAQVAGVKEIAMVTPPAQDGSLNPYTLVAAAELGLEEIYKMGGAQAVFALAWGTDTVPKVDLISGPGNIYVTLAKKMVYGDVNIDMLAGPSEILIIADESANPVYLAADLMSQAEHDPLARSILVTDDGSLIPQVEAELQRQVDSLPRRDVIEKAINTYGAAIVTESLAESCRIANMIAPEHLEIMVDKPFEILHLIENAGAIFMGHHTPEPVGDYFAGPNHILPTGGTARFYSPVTVDTFRKASSLLCYSPAGLLESADKIIKLATVEGLTAHANSIKVRKEKADE